MTPESPRYQDLFPLLYTHPVVAGVTLRGYLDSDIGGPGPDPFDNNE
jgi:hypothetical protein